MCRGITGLLACTVYNLQPVQVNGHSNWDGLAFRLSQLQEEDTMGLRFLLSWASFTLLFVFSGRLTFIIIITIIIIIIIIIIIGRLCGADVNMSDYQPWGAGFDS